MRAACSTPATTSMPLKGNSGPLRIRTESPNAETTTAPYRADKIDISAWKLSSIGSKELLFASDGAHVELSADDETIVRGG